MTVRIILNDVEQEVVIIPEEVRENPSWVKPLVYSYDQEGLTGIIDTWLKFIAKLKRR